MNATIELTKQELISELERTTGKRLSNSSFYEWLPYCLCKRKPFYTPRDLRKFQFIAERLKRDRHMGRANKALVLQLKTYPEDFE